MGKGSSTVQTQNAPNPLFLAAYGDVLGRAQSAAGQPLQQYPTGPGFNPQNPIASTGNPSWMVAPFSNNQQQAFGQVAGQQPLNAMQPYLKQATNYLQQANAPIWNSVPQFSGAGIAQYQNPYTQQVVGSTEAQLQNINAQQANQLQGNAASQGALGGDRAGVAQAVLAGQQAAQEAPTIAGLYSQGYGQALQEFNTQQQAQLGATEAQRWLGSQGAFASGQLGQEAMGAQLSNIQSELGAGGQQQQQAQANLNVPYYQFQQQQAYPFQTTSWLGNIAEGTGSLAGGTGSTTYPQPSVGSQIAGLGLAGAGIASATGGFGSNGWLSNLWNGGGGINASGTMNGGIYRRGGAVPRRAMGGIASPFPTGAPGGMGIPTMGTSIVPGGVSPTDAPVAGMSGSIVPFGSSGRPSPFVQQMMNPGSTSTTSGGGGGALGDILGIGTTIGKFFLNRGGSVPRYAGGGGILGSSMATHLMPAVGRGIAMPSRMLPRFDDGGEVQYAGIRRLPEDDVYVDPMTGAELPSAQKSPPPAPLSVLQPPPAIDRGAQFTFPSLPPNRSALPTGPAVNAGDLTAPGFGYEQSGNKQVNLYDPDEPRPMPPLVGANTQGILRGPSDYPLAPPSTAAQGSAASDANESDYGPSLDYPGTTSSGSSMGIPGSPGATPTGAPPGGGGITSAEVPHGHRGYDLSTLLIAAGLGMMGGRSPNALTNIGQGGLEGLKFAEQQRERMSAEDLREEEAQWRRDYQTGRVGVSQQRADIYGQHTSAQDALSAERNQILATKAGDRTDYQNSRLQQINRSLDLREELGLGSQGIRQDMLNLQTQKFEQTRKMDAWKVEAKATDQEDAWARSAQAAGAFAGSSDKDGYMQAVKQYRDDRAKLGSAPTAAPAAPAVPQVGEMRGGYRFIGGDPANQQSWTSVQ